MTDLTDEAVKALLDGATPGPWRADGEPWNRVVWSPDGNRVCFMAHSNGLNDERDTATSNLVAAAPDLARALLDARADAQAAVALVVERAVEAVEGIRVMFLMATPDDWDEGDNATFEFIKDQLRDLAPDADTAAIRRAAEETGT